MRKMPERVARMRQQICLQAGCKAATIPEDPCAVCPEGHWGAYGKDCRASEPALPSLSTMAVSFAGAVTRDVLTGSPRRTEEESIAILRDHCKQCPKFRHSDQRCSLCGCPMADKIPMAREHCPIGKW